MSKLVDLYELTYTARDLPLHLLYQIQGIKHKALCAGSATNRKLAEWMLNKIEYESKQLLRTYTSMGTIDKEQAVKVGTYLKHIHANCRDEIESKFDKPLISDEEVGEIFFENMIADSLKRENYSIQEGFKKGNGALRLEIDSRKKKTATDDLIEGVSKYAGYALVDLLTGDW